MVEIEFLTPEPAGPVPPAGSDKAPRRRAAPAEVGRWAPPVLWTLAAVLVLVAPFRMLYRLSLRAFTFRETEQFDGWGRVAQPKASFSEHGPRYGLLLCVVAGVFLIAAGVTLVHVVSASATVRRRLALRPVGTGAGLVGLGLLVGTLGAALIDVQSVVNNINAQLASPSDDESVVNGAADPSAQLELGGAVWLSLAAFVLAVAALAITTVQARRAAGIVVAAAVPTASPEVTSMPTGDQVPLPIDAAFDDTLQPIAPPVTALGGTDVSDEDMLR